MRHKDCYIEQDIMMLSLFQLYLQSWLHQGRPLDQQSLDGEEQHCIHQLLDAVAWLRASVRMGSFEIRKTGLLRLVKRVWKSGFPVGGLRFFFGC